MLAVIVYCNARAITRDLHQPGRAQKCQRDWRGSVFGSRGKYVTAGMLCLLRGGTSWLIEFWISSDKTRVRCASIATSVVVAMTSREMPMNIQRVSKRSRSRAACNALSSAKQSSCAMTLALASDVRRVSVSTSFRDPSSCSMRNAVVLIRLSLKSGLFCIGEAFQNIA